MDSARFKNMVQQNSAVQAAQPVEIEAAAEKRKEEASQILYITRV
jgi:hypothetical protein